MLGGEPSRGTPWWFPCLLLELVIVHVSGGNCSFSTFDSPKRDIAIASVQFVHQHDNVRRPGESHRGAGRKKIVHVSGGVLALFAAGCLLFRGIALDGAEHPL